MRSASGAPLKMASYTFDVARRSRLGRLSLLLSVMAVRRLQPAHQPSGHGDEKYHIDLNVWLNRARSRNGSRSDVREAAAHASQRCRSDRRSKPDDGLLLLSRKLTATR